MSILTAAMQKLNALKARMHDLIEPEKAISDAMHEVVACLVNEIHMLRDRIAALETPVPAQPAVAENTGSGASPGAPADEASDGAAQTPAAEGTA